jgi:hypothetical protein
LHCHEVEEDVLAPHLELVVQLVYNGFVERGLLFRARNVEKKSMPTMLLPYTTGSLGRQYWQSFWTILKLALPDKLLRATSDDAPETNSELKFRIRDGLRESFGADPATGKRRGLRTALRELKTGDLART